LFCRSGALAGAEYTIEREATIGTASGNTIQLSPPVISGRHARIFFDEKNGRYMLEEFGSSNGTKVDGIPVRGQTPLDALAVITFANEHDFIFRVRSGGASAKAAAPAARRAESIPAAKSVSTPKPAAPAPDRGKTVFDDGGIATPPAPKPATPAPDRGKTVFDDGGITPPPAPLNAVPAPDRARTVFDDGGITPPPAPLNAVPAPDRAKTVFDDGIITPPPVSASAPGRTSDHPPTAIAMNFEEPSATPPAGDDRGKTVFDDGGGAFAPRAAGIKESYVLIVQMRDGSVEFPLAEGEQVLGREEGVEIRVDDSSVSRRHAALALRGGTVFVRDLGSKNHSFLGAEQLLRETAVPAGSALMFGLVKAQLVAR
jgi:pSer/pThr/pTyr-binding forkhead associated (FHA) protein